MLFRSSNNDDSGLYYSIDGKTWTQSNINSGYFYCVYNANGIWVAGSGSGLWYSVTWKPDTPTLINFTIGTSDFQAERGMTWEQWVNSSYNTEGFFTENNLVLFPGGETPVDQIQPTDIIVDGEQYDA